MKEGNHRTAAIGIVLVIVEPKSAGLSSLGSTYGMTIEGPISREPIMFDPMDIPRSARRISFFEAMAIVEVVDFVVLDTWKSKSKREEEAVVEGGWPCFEVQVAQPQLELGA
jgi:hypothetical protein